MLQLQKLQWRTEDCNRALLTWMHSLFLSLSLSSSFLFHYYYYSSHYSHCQVVACVIGEVYGHITTRASKLHAPLNATSVRECGHIIMWPMVAHARWATGKFTHGVLSTWTADNYYALSLTINLKYSISKNCEISAKFWTTWEKRRSSHIFGKYMR